jgi:hypothetical protein
MSPRAAPTPSPKLLAPEPPPRPPGSRHRLSALLLLGAAAVAGFFYLRSTHTKAPAPEKPRPVAHVPDKPVVRPPPPPEPEKPRPTTPDAERATVASSPPDAEVVAVAPPPVEPPPLTPAPPATDPSEDEEALLKHTEPDADKKVIGGENTPPPPRTGPRPAGGWQSEYPSISVHIVTRPEGAVIKLKDRVFGRAPMNLRFRPGIPIELSFVKSGYQTTTRKFTFGKHKNQSVVVSLPKSKKKGLFRRLFGG